VCNAAHSSLRDESFDVCEFRDDRSPVGSRFRSATLKTLIRKLHHTTSVNNDMLIVMMMMMMMMMITSGQSNLIKGRIAAAHGRHFLLKIAPSLGLDPN